MLWSSGVEAQLPPSDYASRNMRWSRSFAGGRAPRRRSSCCSHALPSSPFCTEKRRIFSTPVCLLYRLHRRLSAWRPTWRLTFGGAVCASSADRPYVRSSAGTKSVATTGGGASSWCTVWYLRRGPRVRHCSPVAASADVRGTWCLWSPARGGWPQTCTPRRYDPRGPLAVSGRRTRRTSRNCPVRPRG